MNTKTKKRQGPRNVQLSGDGYYGAKKIEAVEFYPATKTFQPIASANRPNPYCQPPEKQQDNKIEKFNALFEDIHSTDEE